MKAARLRISGIGEFVKEWKRLSSVSISLRWWPSGSMYSNGSKLAAFLFAEEERLRRGRESDGFAGVLMEWLRDVVKAGRSMGDGRN